MHKCNLVTAFRAQDTNTVDDSLPFVLNIVLALIFSLLGSFAVMVGGPLFLLLLTAAILP